MYIEVVPGLDEQVADADRAECLADQAHGSVGQLLEGAGLLADPGQLVEGVEAMTQGSLRRGAVEQLGAQPEVGQPDAADAGDRLEEVVVKLLHPRRSRPLQMQHAGEPLVDPQGQHGLGTGDPSAALAPRAVCPPLESQTPSSDPRRSSGASRRESSAIRSGPPSCDSIARPR